MKHLNSQTIKFIDEHQGPDFDRHRRIFILNDFWIPYPAATRIYNRMNEILDHPRIYRMPHLLIVAETNNGKSTILRQFLKNHQAYAENGGVYVPVLATIMPEKPTEKLFANSIRSAVDITTKYTDGTDLALEKLFKTIPKIESKVIVIDEVHHLASGPPSQQRHVMNLMKNLSSMFGISFIVAGTREALNLFSADEQLENRFKPMVLPKWMDDQDEDYLSLLDSFESIVPLMEESNLSENFASFILRKSNGKIGDILGYLKAAACYAIKIGEEKITKKILENSGYQTVDDIDKEKGRI